MTTLEQFDVIESKTLPYRGRGLTRSLLIPILSRRYLPNDNQECHQQTVRYKDFDVTIFIDQYLASQDVFKIQDKFHKNPHKKIFLSDSQDILTLASNAVLQSQSYVDRFTRGLQNYEIHPKLIDFEIRSLLQGEDPLLDCEVISYSRYIQTCHLNGENKKYIAPFAHPDHKVLVACGTYYDVRYAVDLMPKLLLDNAREIVAPHENLCHGIPHSLEYHLAQGLIYSGDIRHFKTQIHGEVEKDWKVYETVVGRFNDTISLDLDERCRILDNLRPKLRTIGIFDREDLQKHSTLLYNTVNKIHDWQNRKHTRINSTQIQYLIHEIGEKISENNTSEIPLEPVENVNDLKIHTYTIAEIARWAFERRDKLANNYTLYIEGKNLAHRVAPNDAINDNSYGVAVPLNAENVYSIETLEHALEVAFLTQDRGHQREQGR